MRYATPIDRVQYSLSQGLRVAWYAGHYLAARRLAGPATPPGEPAFVPDHDLPAVASIYASLANLFERDWRNIEAGLYVKPKELLKPASEVLAASRQFFRDLPRVDERRLARRHQEVNDAAKKSSYPRYYLQNFHYQTDGYLSDSSAALYDFQVETLFSGAAAPMRRQALVPLRAALAGRDQRQARLLDVACGTGSFLADVTENYPRLHVTGLDLSPDYLARAEAALCGRARADFLCANAEAMPIEEGEMDVVTAIFLFHELPPKVRRIVAGEMARVLKPGGTLIILDSIQYGDEPAFDGLVDLFPVNFHEPYYTSYAREDVAALFGEAGLAHESDTLAFLSKVMVFSKPG